MKKLETLIISSPHSDFEIPEIQDIKYLVSTPNFDGLPSLQKLKIKFCHELEEIHPSLGNHKSIKYIRVSSSNLKKFPKIDHMKKLETLIISSPHSDFEVPEIQSDMENLVTLSLVGSGTKVFLSSVAVHCPNLISLQVNKSLFSKLVGSWNHFSNLDFSLSKLSVLVHLDLSYCKWLEILPELPTSLVTFKANKCRRLTDMRDQYRNCKWLCQVSVTQGGILNDGDRLLLSMLQGKAIENHSMVLVLEGLQIARELRPCDGDECTLQLPANWCNDFCGFLMCAVIKNHPHGVVSPKISMKPVRGGLMGIDFEDDVVWKESVKDEKTWVGYVSFGSLRDNAAWLDDKCKALSFSISFNSWQEKCSGFGVSLVRRTSGSGSTNDTSPPPQYYSHIEKKNFDFKPEFEIKDDFTCTFQIPSILFE